MFGIILVVIGAIVGVAFKSKLQAWSKVNKWTGQYTLDCGGTENLTITGKTISMEDEYKAIDATANCQITIKDSTIKAGTPIEASDNAKITIIGGHLEGSDGIDADGNAVIDLQDVTVVTTEVGVDAEGNSRVTLEKGKITSQKLAVQQGDNSHIDIKGTDMTGDVNFNTQANVTGLPDSYKLAPPDTDPTPGGDAPPAGH